MTQSELGNKLDPKVSNATMSLWESESRFPSEEYKAQLRKLLGKTSSQSDNGSDEPADEDHVDGPSAIGAWLNKSRLEKNYSVPELAAKAALSPLSIYNIESGKSQNPQRITIEKLERALGENLSTEAKEEAKEESTIEGIGEWFNFNPNSEAEWPNVAGIYVLYDISDRPIYVGQGQRIAVRLRDHHQKFWFRPPIVQNAAYVGVADKQLREQIEKVLIKFLKSNAVLNQQNVDR